MDVDFAIAELPELAGKLIQALSGPTVVALHGPMGAGKTTLVRALCAELGVVDAVNSPTFSLVQEYRTHTGQTVYHLDLYRLNSAEEAWHAGVEEVVESGAWCFIEWPERGLELLPTNTQHVELTVLDETRRRLRFIEG